MVEVRERGWWAELMRWSLMQHGVGRLARRFSICSGIYAETASFYAHAKALHAHGQTIPDGGTSLNGTRTILETRF